MEPAARMEMMVRVITISMRVKPGLDLGLLILDGEVCFIL
jgi:hypothetical protein